jgi:coenzyme F420-reducing hydrogenase beta subunit
LKIVSSELTSREFTGDLNVRSSVSVVTGIARNTKDTSINNCVITVTFYDAQRNNIGVATTSRELLGAGENWDFTAQLTSADAWKARSFDISASNQ